MSASQVTTDDRKIPLKEVGQAETAEAPADVQPPTSPARLIGTLALAGFLSGVLIIGIYEATLPTITANKARELREAILRVLPGVTRIQKLVEDGGALVVRTTVEKGERPIYAGYDDAGTFLGYALPGEGAGFQDTIKILFGFKPDSRRIVGMEVLDSRETPGLGDKIYKDQDFVANFKSLAVDPKVVAVKKGKKSAPNEIDAITGATISSKAMVNIINETDAYWLPKLPEEAPAWQGEAPAEQAATTE